MLSQEPSYSALRCFAHAHRWDQMMSSEPGVLEAAEKDTLSLPGLTPFSREDCELSPRAGVHLFTM